MQQQGELIARRVAAEADNTARIHKAYRLIFGREASAPEVKAGLTFLATEPLKAYEERKSADAKDTKEAKDSKDAKASKEAKKDSDADEGDTAEKAGEGMMAGVIPGAGKKDEAKKMLPPTVWGRYVKILLSSSEFLFVD
jgi:hypothetical protein